MLLVTSREMRLMDQTTTDSFGIPERVLMENAGRGAARYFMELFSGEFFGSIGVLAGKGNNGGDGFVLARYLAQKDMKVVVFLFCKKEQIKTNVSLENFNLLKSLNVSVFEIYNLDLFEKLRIKIENCSVWVDALFGTGFTSSVKGIFKKVINLVNKSEKPIFAVDIPSGVNSDTGKATGACINAYATITFSFPKIGHFLSDGSKCTGRLKIAEIGIPRFVAERVDCRQQLLEFSYIKKRFLFRAEDSHKGTSGRLLIIAGSIGKTGAAVMSSLGAVRSGSGIVTLCIPKSLNCVVEPMLPEVVTVGLPETSLGSVSRLAYDVVAKLLAKEKCVVFGPGIGTDSEALSFLEDLLLNVGLPLVIDADGLNLLAKFPEILHDGKSSIVLTPHPGEMSRLTGLSINQIQNDRIGVSRNFAQNFNVHVVLKGSKTVIAHPNGEVFVNLTGNSGMATAGMGDVLTGMIGSFIAQGYDIGFAAKLSVYLHGLSGDALSITKGPYGYLATEVMNNIPEQIALVFSTYSRSSFEFVDSLAYTIGEKL